MENDFRRFRLFSKLTLTMLLVFLCSTCGGGGSPSAATPSGPLATLSAVNLSFGYQEVSTTSSTQAVTLTNTGNETLNLSGVGVSGTNSKDFAVSNNCSQTILPKSGCTVSITFTPGAVGSATAAVDFTDNASSSPQAVSLSGTGISILPPDPLGTATSSTISCPSSPLAGSCFALAVACPGVADSTVDVKVIRPSGSSRGTVMFVTGGGGLSFYEDDFKGNGGLVVQAVTQAGYTAVEFNFSASSQGWLTGPGGPRKLACRFATATKWVYDQIHNDSVTSPFCATGQSGGAGAVAYALAHYGLGSILDMVEETSGPPFGRIDHGCICNQPSSAGPCGQGLLSECYGTASTILDAAYGSTICSDAERTGDTSNASLFFQDSLTSSDATLAYPTTDVHMVFGGQDNSGAVLQGMDWASLIETKVSIDCVPDAPHQIAAVSDGATKIANDLQSYCKVQ